jgi:hypothetical protein
MFKKANLLRFSTLLAWLATVALAYYLTTVSPEVPQEEKKADAIQGVRQAESKEKKKKADPTWSDSMIHSIKAGFHTGGTTPIMALQLADTLVELEGVLPDTPDGEKDRRLAIAQVAADNGFIPAYTLLFILLILRGEASRWRLILLVLALGIGLADGMENRLLLAALESLRAPGPEIAPSLPMLWCCAALKWMGLFTLITCIGYQELTRPRKDVLPSILRCLMGLLLLCGGLTGLAWGFGKNSGLLIENGLVFMAAALILLPFLVWKPDTPWR